MKELRRIATGVAFVATIALGLVAGGGDAFAKNRGGGGNTHNNGGGTITITVDPSSDLVIDLGITWE